MEIQRELYFELKEHLGAKEISMIVGPRQVGKTTLMLALRDELSKKGIQSVFLNLDVESDKQYVSSQDQLIQKIHLELGEQEGVVFIDEIQRKEDAGLFLKGIYDLNLPYKFVVSGSGSLELKEHIHESLAGRKRLFQLNPVSFHEFIQYKTNYQYSGRLATFFQVERDKTTRFLNEYLNFGGYPRVVIEPKLSEKYKILDEIFRSYIEKDIAYLLRINRPDAFTTLIKLLASQLGQLVNYSEIASQLGISVPTLKNYLWYAEKTYVIKMLPPFFTNLRKEITKSKIVYFYDLGLRNYSLGISGMLTNPKEFSFLFQNLVGNMLEDLIRWSGTSLHFWRTSDKSEVDFIVKSYQQIVPIEVKYSIFKKPTIRRSLRSFIEKYTPQHAYVITPDFTGALKINTTDVLFLPFYQLPGIKLI